MKTITQQLEELINDTRFAVDDKKRQSEDAALVSEVHAKHLRKLESIMDELKKGHACDFNRAMDGTCLVCGNKKGEQ